MPERTCIGCRCTADTDGLVRIAWRDAGLEVDLARRVPGRGAWLCAAESCFERAARRGAFARALRRPVSAEAVVICRAAFGAAVSPKAGDVTRSSGSETRSGD